MRTPWSGIQANSEQKGGESVVVRTERERSGSGRVRADPCIGRRRRDRHFGAARPCDWERVQQYRQQHLSVLWTGFEQTLDHLPETREPYLDRASFVKKRTKGAPESARQTVHLTFEPLAVSYRRAGRAGASTLIEEA